MPIEIRELVIRARVDPDAEGCAPGRKSAEAPGAGTPQRRAGARRGDDVAACVQEVMRILEEKSER